MKQRGFHLNDYTASVTIQLFSNLNMQKEAIEFYESQNMQSVFVNSCMIKMFIQHENYEEIIKFAQKIQKKDKVIYS